VWYGFCVIKSGTYCIFEKFWYGFVGVLLFVNHFLEITMRSYRILSLVVLLGASLQITGCAPQLLLSGASILTGVVATGAINKSAAEKHADNCYAIRKERKPSAELTRDLQRASCPLS